MPPIPAELSAALRDRFAILREIGRGGMGTVYLARDLRLDRLVAMKVLPPDPGADPVARERFIREARTAARLSHPNIVPVYQADEVEGTAFFVMAYVEGESLGEHVRNRGPLPPAEAVRILREVAWALAYAHARGVVHRDVKPENVLLERRGEGGAAGRALVTDFGIARHLDVQDSRETRLTQAGAVLGTLHFMSPEQATGEPVDGRSDLYALGVLAYYVLSGRLPFDDVQGPGVIVAHATREPPPLRARAPDVPPQLAAVVERCLAKRPEDRYATGEALAEALERALAESPIAEHDRVLSEDQAVDVWRRAAQLQADALRRLEPAPDLLTAPAAAPDPSGGYRLAHIAAAAEEAGISRQYVAMALAELPPDRPARPALIPVSDKTVHLYLGTNEYSFAVTHVIDATPARVFRALGAVLPQAPYKLKLREIIGPHPIDGGVIVFDLPGPIMTFATYETVPDKYWMGTHHQLEARQVQVTLRAMPGATPRTSVTMTCDARPGVMRNLRWAQGLVAAAGAAVALISGGVALAAGGVALLDVFTIALGAGSVAGGGALVGYRKLYPSVIGKARREMLGALEDVASRLQAEEVFGAGYTADAAPGASGASGATGRG